ncbi:MAG TPA: 3-oxoadipate enol-lactonase [Candidatus Saccharimonadales bacterium]|nr:3-oxoadipate enol-lactonase [Candidatus Saccharimonadales bacterium]
MPSLKAYNAQVHYEIHGDETAPVVILSHSLGVDGDMWRPQVSSFAERFRVVRYDTRGHGQTTASPGPYSVDLLGRDVIALLDELRLERVHFCGLSMGGAVGMWLGVNAPERLNRLVLSNTAAKLGTAEGWKSRIESVKKSGMQAVAPGIIERWFTAGFRESHREIVSSTQKTIEETDPGGYVACCEALSEMDLRSTISEITVPTLVVVGAHDPVTTPADGRFLTEKIRGARYVELDAAHLSNIEDAQHFSAAVAGFLSA